MKPSSFALTISGTCIFLACNTGVDNGPEITETTTDPTSVGVATDNSDASDATNEDDSNADSASASDDGPKLDIDSMGTNGTLTASDEGDEPGCQKVDFLFIIDNSGSMAEEQSALIASFDGFISAIDQNIAAEQDFHILVTDSDEWVWSGCGALCNFFPPPMDGTPGEPTTGCIMNPEFNCGYFCNVDDDCLGLGGTETCVNFRCGGTQTQPMQCENILGAGVTFPRGQGASNVDCDFASSARYMDSSEGIALVGKFSCAAGVGIGSTETERPMEAMVEAVTETASTVATCNDGFLRDDAILVVTFITDEDDNDGDGSSGSAAEWYDKLVEAKNGDPAAVVMLGIYGPGSCAESSTRLDSFMGMWDAQGLKGDVCASDYTSFFDEAVELIDTTCDGFIPPG